MKKKYGMPAIQFQSLALSTGVSSGCYYISSFEVNACAIEIPEWGETVFAKDSDCDLSNEDYPCYNVPLANSNVFES